MPAVTRILFISTIFAALPLISHGNDLNIDNINNMIKAEKSAIAKERNKILSACKHNNAIKLETSNSRENILVKNCALGSGATATTEIGPYRTEMTQHGVKK
jgi:hypothetical protein